MELKLTLVLLYTVTEALLEINSTFPEKKVSRSTVYRWFRKIKNGTCDEPRKVWQRRKRLPIVDDLVELITKNPYSTSRNLAKFLNCSKNTILRRLYDLGYKNKWSTWIPHNLSPNHEQERQRIAELLLSRELRCSFIDRIITADEKCIMCKN